LAIKICNTNQTSDEFHISSLKKKCSDCQTQFELNVPLAKGESLLSLDTISALRQLEENSSDQEECKGPKFKIFKNNEINNALCHFSLIFKSSDTFKTGICQMLISQNGTKKEISKRVNFNNESVGVQINFSENQTEAEFVEFSTLAELKENLFMFGPTYSDDDCCHTSKTFYTMHAPKK
jgi:hypothetical protein